jgi:hypothetical protein
MRLITEITRFQFPMTVDDGSVAKCFGLEIAPASVGLIPRFQACAGLLQRRKKSLSSEKWNACNETRRFFVVA